MQLLSDSPCDTLASNSYSPTVSLPFFGYVLVTFAFGREVSWIIAIAILATGYGAKGGQIIEKILERNAK